MLDTLPAELVLPDQQDRLRLVAMCAEAVEHDHAATLSVEEAVHLIELVVAGRLLLHWEEWAVCVCPTLMQPSCIRNRQGTALDLYECR